ncbi:hypothetical protein HDU81_002608 [Chytriomyces hyalinus]|nr:hypothetical protein HDU81_002608 [Chytriomyces hyalinus]
MFSKINSTDANTSSNADSNSSYTSKIASTIDNKLPNIVRDQIHPTPKTSETISTDLPHLPQPPVDEVKPNTAATYPSGIRPGDNVAVKQDQPSMLQQMEQGVKGLFHKE